MNSILILSVRRFLSRLLTATLLFAALPLNARPTGKNRTASVTRDTAAVKVNRTVPAVEPAPAELIFSAQPADEEITRARVFGEPLLKTDESVSSDSENQALAQALLAYRRAADAEDVAPLTGFLKRHPDSGWRASLLASLGAVYRHLGYFTKAIAVWEETWALTKDGRGKNTQAVANQILGELAGIHTHLGHKERLEALFAELDNRDLHGPTTERITIARESLWRWRVRPEEEFRCGPMSLARMRAHLKLPDDPRILKARATRHGMSLTQVAALAAQSGMKSQMARRQPGAPIIFPAVAHWKVDHYSAILDRKEEGGKEYYLVQNPLFEAEMWVSRAALDEETSGYFLVPLSELPTGWQPVSRQKGNSVWGRCWTGVPDDQQTACYSEKVGGDSCPTCPCQDPPPGMPRYSFHTLLVSLNIMDTPVGYTPPRGPAVRFTLTYNQREAHQPATFSFSNLGPKWTFNWLSYVTDKADAVIYSGDAPVYLRGGGQEEFRLGVAPLPRSGGINKHSQAELVLTSFVRYQSAVYERRLPDGSKEIFAQPDGVTKGNRRVFLTQVVDPAGNSVKLTYDSRLRVVALTDAIGQVTTISYELPDDPLKITKVTDPFGRSAVFSYDAQGRLSRITDVIGLTSEFTYVANDFISSLKTPYGTTNFRNGILPLRLNTSVHEMHRWLQATDPMRETERLEYHVDVPGQPNKYGATLYWDKRAWRETPKDNDGNAADYTRARLYRWMLGSAMHQGNLDSGVKFYEKHPLESNIRYSYPERNPNDDPPQLTEDALGLPTGISRTLDDGTTQTSRFQYNPRGRVTQSIDPAGRNFSFAYADNQIDLLEAYNDKTNEVLARLSYNSQHLPLTYTDAAGQTTRYTYNAQGQITSVTNPKGEMTAFNYDNNGYLLSVTRPIGGATTNFTWDGYGRVRSVTDSEGYTQTFDYDALDRPTRVTFPDGTFEQITYDRLDAVEFRDRLGRVTRAAYDALQRLTSVTDPLGRVTRMEWCNCGDLERLIDPKGNVTTWTRDLQGRVISKKLADDSLTQYSYEKNTSRLRQIIDARGQIINYQYTIDDNLQQISFGGVRTRPPRSNDRPRTAPVRRVRQSVVASPEQISRSVAEESAAPERSRDISDVSALTPTVSFTWDANYDRLVSFQDGTGKTAYSYHPVSSLGALQVAAVDGPLDNDTISYGYDELGRIVNRTINGATLNLTYDALGRVTNEVNRLGAFAYSYVNATGRVASIRYPNGQGVAFSYFDNNGDQRLKQIRHLAANQALLSQFDYTYLVTGEIESVTRQFAAAPSTNRFSYDLASQLTGAVLSGGNFNSFGYTYDPAGNRTSERINSGVMESLFNSTNQLVRQQGGGQAQQFVYDTGGNLISDGARSLEWDALDRLTAIVMGNHRTEFSYDALDRRTRIVEKENNAVVSDKRLIWCGGEICEERDVTSAVTKRFFAQGETEATGGSESLAFYTKDHLGSVRELTDSGGNVIAGYDYDPFGRMTRVSGNRNAAFGYAGYYTHAPSGLNLTLHRAYDPGLGRWLSRDPIGEDGGLNLYAYVGNEPVNFSDPSGLSKNPFDWWQKATDFLEKLDQAGASGLRDRKIPNELEPAVQRTLCEYKRINNSLAEARTRLKQLNAGVIKPPNGQTVQKRQGVYKNLIKGLEQQLPAARDAYNRAQQELNLAVEEVNRVLKANLSTDVFLSPLYTGKEKYRGCRQPNPETRLRPLW
jgi:RHS repeat-associated protein